MAWCWGADGPFGWMKAGSELFRSCGRTSFLLSCCGEPSSSTVARFGLRSSVALSGFGAPDGLALARNWKVCDFFRCLRMSSSNRSSSFKKSKLQPPFGISGIKSLSCAFKARYPGLPPLSCALSPADSSFFGPAPGAPSSVV